MRLITFTLFPIVLSISLYLIRNHRPFKNYLITASVILIITTAFWQLYPGIVFYSNGPLNAAGSSTWVIPAQALLVFIINLYKPVITWAKYSIFTFTILTALFISLLGGWIS